jgi:thymidylate synthase (FAD)
MSEPASSARPDHDMSVKLLYPDAQTAAKYYVPLIYTACRTCYSELSPQEIFAAATGPGADQAKQHELIKRVIESGHGSTIEHVNFTFAISGVSRALTHQLVRHRIGVSFDQQSQRYVSYKKGISTLTPSTISDSAPQTQELYDEQMAGALKAYKALQAAGIPAEDARFVFPNATRTNIVMTANLRALIHMSGLRLCVMSQWEIRRLFGLMRHEVRAVSPFLAGFLMPKCVPAGYCDEANNRDGHCRIRPHKDDVLAAYAQMRAAQKAKP